MSEKRSSVAPRGLLAADPAHDFDAAPPRISFEFFPPKTPEMEERLWEVIKRVEPLGPRFVSVTYGAGGSTRERTHHTVRRIRADTALEPAAHLTCVAATRQEIDAVAHAYWQAGVRHIVALRGDPPNNPLGGGATSGERYAPHPGGYDFAADLVAGLRRVADFEISVAAYPETHPEAASAGHDLDNLKAKLDAGASRAITQFFFDVDLFLDFRDRAAAAGIGGAFRRARRRSRHAPPRRHLTRRRAVPPAASERGQRISLLHAQPRRFDRRDLPHARRPRAESGGGVSALAAFPSPACGRGRDPRRRRGRVRVSRQQPSPVYGLAPAATLSRNAGEGLLVILRSNRP
jgi:5,10-methylenetetrahydrofolate reductase